MMGAFTLFCVLYEGVEAIQRMVDPQHAEGASVITMDEEQRTTEGPLLDSPAATLSVGDALDAHVICAAAVVAARAGGFSACSANLSIAAQRRRGALGFGSMAGGAPEALAEAGLSAALSQLEVLHQLKRSSNTAPLHNDV